MNMASSISLAARFLILCLLSSAGAIGAGLEVGSVSGTWSKDLRPVIKGTPLAYVYSGTYEIKGPLSTSLWFVDNNTIVVTFVTQVNVGTDPRLARREGENLPLRLQAIFLDSKTGAVETTREWPSESRNASIVATLEGKFVTQTGNELTLYGSNLEKLRSLMLSPSPSQFEWYATSSFTGKSLLLRLGHKEPEQSLFSWVWIKTENLQTVHSWEAQPEGSVSITDDAIALTTMCTSIGCDPTNIKVKKLSTDWTVIGLSYDRRIFFVNEDELFLPGDPSPNLTSKIPARLIHIDGQLAFSETEQSKASAWWNPPVRSSEGRRFVAPGLRVEGAHPILDVDGHTVLERLLIYDLLDRSPPYVLDVRGPKIKDLNERDFALSPDGSELAILDNETVRLFKLPPVQ